MTNDDEAMILHWNEQSETWDRISESAWRSFRDTPFLPLRGIRNGDHSFVVCIVDENKSLFNIIPHKYRLDDDGRITSHRFDDLSEDERSFVAECMIDPIGPDHEGQKRFRDLRERMWRGSLPPRQAADTLIRALPGLPLNADCPAVSFLRAFGVTAPSRQMQ